MNYGDTTHTIDMAAAGRLVNAGLFFFALYRAGGDAERSRDAGTVVNDHYSFAADSACYYGDAIDSHFHVQSRTKQRNIK